MKPTYRIPYDRMDWLWISNHWDAHLEGLCRVQGRIMRFVMPPTWEGHEELPHMHVFRLALWEKIRWLARKRFFEICVGEHWTYPQRRNGHKFHLKRPKWFWQAVFKFYYFCVRPRRKREKRDGDR